MQPSLQTTKEFDEKVIAIDRVARVVRGGRRFRFRSIVVVGDGNGRVGVGVGKGSEVMTSIAKAVSTAKKSMISVPMNGTTIPHEVTVRFCGAEVLLKPASQGTGVIAGGAVRSVVEAAGIHDLLTKSFGSTNKVNNAYAAVMALSQLEAGPVPKTPSRQTKPEPKEQPKADTQAKAKAVAKPAAKKAPAKKPATKPKKEAAS